jgi:hypothetical protein
MTVIRSLAVLAALALAACQSVSSHIASTLVASTELAKSNPSDVAVLPVEDATFDGRVRPWRDVIRAALARGLVTRLYSPLALDKVDAVIERQGLRPGSATAIDASYLRGVAGKFGEEALLAVRFTRWDESSLMANARLRFACDLTMVDARSGSVLWSGGIEGEVKAGGYGPAPLGPEERARDAAQQVAVEVIDRLPKRRV